MSTREIKEYYEQTKNSLVRPDLAYAINLMDGAGIAIDCGCGAGSDIAFLRKNHFTVHAFDVEEDSIRLCQQRFNNDRKVFLFQDSFGSFDYPNASLIVADASLFFCPHAEFEGVWNKISKSLMSDNGLFCGSFLGPNDTMAGPDYDKDAFWPEVIVFTEKELRKNFAAYEIIKWTEHNLSGETPQGTPHNWHIFSVVAKKL